MLIAPEPVEKIKCSSCTFENKMVFTFISILSDNTIEKKFYEFLTEKGIKVEIESNAEELYCEIDIQKMVRVIENIVKNAEKYSFPKIMYVPAERNFVSSVEKPDLIKRLPLPLYTFMDEYEEAKQNIKGNIQLPIGNVKFEYKKSNRKSYISGEDYNIELTEASSGYQSMVPLILVTKYLSDLISNKIHDNRKDINREEEIKIRKAVTELLKDNKITEEVLKAALEEISSRFKYESFINVVEEPEQNLFPLSQKEILFELLKYNNENINNEQYFQAQRLVTDSISQQMATGTDCKESNTGCYP